jgi:hypothetical protein
VPEDKSDLIRDGLERLTAAGVAIQWKGYGPSVTVTRDVTRQICAFEAGKAWITLQASGGLPPEPFEEAAKSLASLEVGTQSKDGWYRHIRWNACTAEEASTALDVAVTLATRLAPAVAWEPLDAPVAVTFTRNDHNIWVKHVPGLNGLVGRRLRGRLERAPGGREVRSCWCRSPEGSRAGGRRANRGSATSGPPDSQARTSSSRRPDRSVGQDGRSRTPDVWQLSGPTLGEEPPTPPVSPWPTGVVRTLAGRAARLAG